MGDILPLTARGSLHSFPFAGSVTENNPDPRHADDPSILTQTQTRRPSTLESASHTFTSCFCPAWFLQRLKCRLPVVPVEISQTLRLRHTE